MLNMSRRLRLLIPILALGLVLSGCGLMNLFSEVTAVAQASGLNYAIVDTSQALTYDNANALAIEPSAGSAFYGQDAQIDGNQPCYMVNEFIDNGNAANAVASAKFGETSIPLGSETTVTDLTTGLTWTQGTDWNGDSSIDSDDKLAFDEAQAFVDTLNSQNYGGYSDWRMPTIKELYSLIDFSGKDVDPMSSSASSPFIDTNYFDFAYGNMSAGERIIDSQWATTTLYVAGDLMFGVNFADGRIKGYGLTDPRTGSEKTFYVRYVRGNTSYGENDFVDNNDGTISDLATGLMWSQDDSGVGMDWEDALAYVQDLNNQNYLGYSDWTLPNAKELQSIVDYTRSPDTTNSAAIDPAFNTTAITNEDGDRDWGFYWTGTTHASARGGQAAVYVAFGRGLGYMNNRYVDVHGAGCQRSDPKSGSAVPTGRGPQGDVVRIANYVRVVRDNGSTASAGACVKSDESSIPLVGNVATIGEAGEQDEDFILFAPLGGTTAYLINRDGHVVNKWALSGKPGNSVYLTEGGNLLATYTVQGSFSGGGIGGGIELLTWDGDEVWSYQLATDHAHLHHDIEMLPNGNVLMISWESKTRAEALAAGLRPNQLPHSGEVWSEMILEYDPLADRIVWEWHLWDHALPIGEDPIANPGKIDLEFASNRQSSDWWHLNAIDYNENLDQIVVSSRNVSEFWIIDHDLTTAQVTGVDGDLLYRYGNPEAYGASGVQGLLHQHDCQWLDEGNSPGVASSSFGTSSGSRILVFDNGDPRLHPTSRILELNLPDYQSGSASQAWVLPSQIVWQYPSEEAGMSAASGGFFADHISGAQRLVSGNTLICLGTEGRFFEVTSSGEIVWEYVNPYTSIGPGNKVSNEVFRAESYLAHFIGQGLSASSDTSLAQPSSQATAQSEQ